jgi:hypothetical protein
MGEISWLSWLTLVFSAALACGCSSNPKPEDASAKTEETTQGETFEPGTSASAEPSADPGEVPPSGVKATGVERNEDNSVPDDYSLTERDCVDLGKKKAELALADFRAQVGPKVTEKQRQAAEPGFQSAAEKDGSKFADGCLKSLVNKVVDPKALKCAFAAKDVKAFEKCLN